MKTLRRPPELLHMVCACVATVIGWDSAVHPHDVAWSDCRDMLAECVPATPACVGRVAGRLGCNAALTCWCVGAYLPRSPDLCHYMASLDLTGLHPHVMGPLATILAVRCRCDTRNGASSVAEVPCLGAD